MGVLTSTSRVKAALQIPTGVTLHDARLAQVVEEVEGELLAQTTLLAWATSTHTEYLPSRVNSDVLMLSRFPVLAVAAVTLVVGSTAMVVDEDYEWKACGSITRLPEGAGWPQGRRQVVVTYQAGALVSGATPADLIRVATLAAARQYVLEPIAGLSDSELQPMRRTVAKWTEDAIRIEVDRAMARFRSAL